jgi:hypothetical protein
MFMKKYSVVQWDPGHTDATSIFEYPVFIARDPESRKIDEQKAKTKTFGDAQNVQRTKGKRERALAPLHGRLYGIPGRRLRGNV